MIQAKPTHFYNLDGFRAIAAFFVIFAHISYWFKYPDTSFFETYKFILSFGSGGGRMCVIFFFVLSGFLITYLMYLEQSKHGKLNVLYFYIRRALRIWPLYYLTLIIGFFIYPAYVSLTGQSHHENANLLYYSFFAANFDHIYNYFPSCNILGVQWSVAVEEQFYLLWPLVFLLFNNKRLFPYILIACILFSKLFHAVVASNLKGGDYHLLSCFKYLALGALIAYICYNKTETVRYYISKIKKWVSILIYIVCVFTMLFQEYLIANLVYYKYLYHIVPFIFFGYVIVEQNFSDNSFYKIGNSSLLKWLGKISYGLYLTHMIAINIVIEIFTNSSDFVIIKGLLSVLITILLSYLSYNYFEKYFLSWKKRFSFLEKQN